MKARCFTEPTELYIFIGSAQGQLLLIVNAYQSPLPFPIQVWYDTPAIDSDVLCTYMSCLVFICVEVSFVSQFQFRHSMTLEFYQSHSSFRSMLCIVISVLRFSDFPGTTFKKINHQFIN